jgi:hypothetical protein
MDEGLLGADETQSIIEPIVKVKDSCGGFWTEMDVNGNKRYLSEPSFHVEVKGSEKEIEKRTCLLGYKYNEPAVIVAVHDQNEKNTGVFTMITKQDTSNAEKESIAQHFVDAGIGGVTVMLYKPGFRFIAFGKNDMDIARKAVKALPLVFQAKLTYQSARVRIIESAEYKTIIEQKADSLEVTAEIFIMGVSKASALRQKAKDASVPADV